MGYFRVPNDLDEDPRFQQAGMAATGLWIKLGCWCSKHGTSGRFSMRTIRSQGGTPRQIAKLVSSGLWEPTDDGYRLINWRKSQDGDYRPNISPKIRAAVYERDGYACTFCGSTESLSLDHIIRYRDDGPDTEDNLRTLCMPCNWGRG